MARGEWLSLLAIVGVLGFFAWLYGLPPDCPEGTVLIFNKLGGWVCVAGVKP